MWSIPLHITLEQGLVWSRYLGTVCSIVLEQHLACSVMAFSEPEESQGTYHAPGTMWLPDLFSLILKTAQEGRECYYSHFTGKKTETERDARIWGWRLLAQDRDPFVDLFPSSPHCAHSLPFQSSQHPSRYRNTQGSRQWPG